MFGPSLPRGADPQRVGYEGVTLDAGKPATAIVYVDVTQPVRFPAQPLQVSLIARYHGKQIGTTTLTTGITNPPQSSTGYVTTAERDNPAFGVQFPIPPFWLTVPATLGDSFDLEARVGFPVGTSPLSIQECDAATVCSADDVFRLIGLPAVNLTPLNVLSVELRGTGQAVGSLNPAAAVMSSASQLFPGGEGMSLPPFAGSVDVSIWKDLPANSIFCRGGEGRPFLPDGVRAGGAGGVGRRQPQERPGRRPRGAQLPDGQRRQQSRAGLDHAQTRPAERLSGTPVFLVNDGTAGRPRTAAAHEFGHVLGAPHASNACGGGTGGQIGEDWTPDQIGLLQGVKFDRLAPLVGGKVDPVVDGPTPLFDLMSYCGPGSLPTDTTGGVVDGSAWISPHNWNRTLQTMLDYQRHLGAASSEGRGATATAGGDGLRGRRRHAERGAHHACGAARRTRRDTGAGAGIDSEIARARRRRRRAERRRRDARRGRRGGPGHGYVPRAGRLLVGDRPAGAGRHRAHQRRAQSAPGDLTACPRTPHPDPRPTDRPLGGVRP